jgi:hypothetical protein
MNIQHPDYPAKWRKVFGDAFAKGVVLEEEVQKMPATLDLNELQLSTIDKININFLIFGSRKEFQQRSLM